MDDFKGMKNSELAKMFSSYFGITTSMNALTNNQFEDVAKIFEKATYKSRSGWRYTFSTSDLLSSALARLQSDDVAYSRRQLIKPDQGGAILLVSRTC